jgi:hypothetical protein
VLPVTGTNPFSPVAAPYFNHRSEMMNHKPIAIMAEGGCDQICGEEVLRRSLALAAFYARRHLERLPFDDPHFELVGALAYPSSR